MDSISSAASRPAVSVAATQPQRGAGRGARQLGDALQPRLVDARRRQGLGQAPGLRDLELLQAREQLVLGVGGVQGVERASAEAARSSASLLEPHELLGVVALDAGLDEVRQAPS